jgi:predicted nucleic acid-binding protein
MLCFDTSYIVRLYAADPGWEKVRALAATDNIACSLHGQAEAIAAFHRKFREGTLNQPASSALLKQFDEDCAAGAFTWRHLSPVVVARIATAYASLPAVIRLRAADAIHLASAAEGQFKEVDSNDTHLRDAASHFGLRGINLICG